MGSWSILRIRDLTPGERCLGYLQIAQASVRTDRRGHPYGELTFRDLLGAQVKGRWFGLPGTAKLPAVGDVVIVDADVETFCDRTQLKLRGLEPAPIEGTLAFVPQPEGDQVALRAELQQVIDEVETPPLRGILQACFTGELLERFCQAPASLSYHQARLGGLLGHTLGVVRLCQALCRQYPDLDRDLLLAGALLHDVGKVDELALLPALHRTDVGRALGHLALGLVRVARLIDELPAFPEPLEWRLLHLLAGHHGALEHGSPVVPVTLEAVALHLADQVDAKLSGFVDHVARNGAVDGWTAWSPMFSAELRVPDRWAAPAVPDLQLPDGG